MLINKMAAVAAECIKTPGRLSVWSPRLSKYVCPETEDEQTVLMEAIQLADNLPKHPPINPQFKLIFLTAASGTLLFVVLCLVLTLVAGKQPPPLFEKVIMGFFDLAKIGFGALVGLLGGKSLQAEADQKVKAVIKGKK